MKKRILVGLLVVCMLAFVPATLGGCVPRERTLRIYNWGYFMDESIFADFEAYWAEQNNGERIRVRMRNYHTNEELYNEIARGRDHDLIVPSDYMLERMIAANMIRELEPATRAVAREAVNPDLVRFIEHYDNDFRFGMPYKWGTLGIIYNTQIPPRHIADNASPNYTVDSWAALFDVAGMPQSRIIMKDSERDAFTAALLFHYRAELMRLQTTYGVNSTQYRAKLDSIFAPDLTDTARMNEMISTAEAVLVAQRAGVVSYSGDAGITDINRGRHGGREFGMYWSCDMGYLIVSGYANNDLRYVVPVEGGNVWVNSVAVPTTAANPAMANAFIRFLAQREIAQRNMLYTGATTAIRAAADYIEENLDSFDFYKDAEESFRPTIREALFPSAATIQRSAVMRDFGEFQEQLELMWARVKRA